MSNVIAVCMALLTFATALFQVTLLWLGVCSFFSRSAGDKLGHFSLWGKWHWGVFASLMALAGERYELEMARFQLVALQLEGLPILAKCLFLPLLLSLAISILHRRISDSRIQVL